MTTMRQRFYEFAREALDEDERVAVVTAQIGAEAFGEHPRHFDVGIREQLMIGVAAGLALEGLRPVVHSYTPFLVERPYEQIKLDLGHQDLGAILVSTGASYDSARSGRTHQAPEDVAALGALPGWTIYVPGHPDEVERMFRAALHGDDRVYIRLSEETNGNPVDGNGLVVVRRGSRRWRRRRSWTRRSPTSRPCGRSTAQACAQRCAERTSPSSSRTSPERHRRRSQRRSSTARIGCSRSAFRTPSSAATARRQSTGQRTASTRPGSEHRWTRGLTSTRAPGTRARKRRRLARSCRKCDF